MTSEPDSGAWRVALAPLVFVFIWSTGFIVARAIAPVADPNLFLAVRFALATVLLAALAVAARAAWPGRQQTVQLLGIGALLQGLYLGAGFWAVGNGLPAGLMALLGAMQPVLTAALSTRMFGETTSTLNKAGIALGMLGLTLAVWPKTGGDGVAPLVVLVGVFSTLSITAGTLLQKTSVRSVALLPSSAIQHLGGCLVVVVLAALLGEHRFEIGRELLAALAWAVLVLSIGGTTLLLWMVRRGRATAATSLLFLVPPLAAVIAWLAFGETLSALQLSGFAIAVVGVWLARREATPARP